MVALFRRRFTRVVLILMLLLAAILVAARLLVPVDRVRDLLVAKIEAATGAEVSFGAATVDLWPRLQVVVSDGEVKGTGQSLREAAQIDSQVKTYGISLERLEIDLALGPLLKRRIETGKIRLVRPRIELVMKRVRPGSAGGERRQGENDQGGGEEGGAAIDDVAGSAPPPVVMPWELAVAGLEVKDGALFWREAGSTKQITVTGWEQEIAVGDLTLLLQRLLAFQVGAQAAPATVGEPLIPGEMVELNVQSKLGELTVRGFGQSPPLILDDLRLTGTLAVPPGAEKLRITIQKLTWEHLILAADLDVLPPAADGFMRLRGSWRLQPVSLLDLVADAAGLMPPPASSPAREWLDREPVTAGDLQLGGRLDVPWPLPPRETAEVFLAGFTAEGEIAAGRLEMPSGQGEINLQLKGSLVAGNLELSDLAVTESSGAFSVTGRLQTKLGDAGGPLRAELKGTGRLAALQELVETLAPPGAGETVSPRVDGTVQWQLLAEIADPPRQAADWRERLLGGELQGVQLSGDVADLVISEVPGAPWTVGAVIFASDLRTAEVTCRAVNHAAVRGGFTGSCPRLFPSPVVDLHLQVNRLDVDQLVTIFGESEQTASRVIPVGSCGLLRELIDGLVAVAHAAAPVRPASRPLGELIPVDLRVNYTGRADTVFLQKARYDDIEIGGKLVARELHFETVTARRSTGRITGHGKIDYASDPHGLLTFTAEAQEVPAGALIEPYAAGISRLWEGSVNANASGQCRLRDKQAVLSSLTLGGDALSSNGTIDARSLLAGISSYLGERQDLKLIQFQEFLHHFEVIDGRYHVKDLQLDGRQSRRGTDWTGNGWLGFDGGIDLSLQVWLPEDFLPDLGQLSPLVEFFRDESENTSRQGRIKLDLRMTGQARNPNVSLNFEDAKARMQRQTQDRVQDALQQGVQGLLDKFKGN